MLLQEQKVSEDCTKVNNLKINHYASILIFLIFVANCVSMFWLLNLVIIILTIFLFFQDLVSIYC